MSAELEILAPAPWRVTTAEVGRQTLVYVVDASGRSLALVAHVGTRSHAENMAIAEAIAAMFNERAKVVS